MNIKANDLSMQDAAGMQLVELLRQLNNDVEELANKPVTLDGKEVKLYPITIAHNRDTDSYEITEGYTYEQLEEILGGNVIPIMAATVPGTGSAIQVVYNVISDISLSGTACNAHLLLHAKINFAQRLDYLNILMSINTETHTIVNQRITFLPMWRSSLPNIAVQLTEGSGGTYTINTSDIANIRGVLAGGGIVHFILPYGTMYSESIYTAPDDVVAWRYGLDGSYSKLIIDLSTRTVTKEEYTIAITPVT